MHLPNYNDGSIVNLMSSILAAYGEESTYKPLRNVNIENLKRSTNIVLLVIDGLGHEFLKRHISSSLSGYPCHRITSVFPPTTATAITTFSTGLAPQQHAITGWFVYLKEVGSVVKILPFVPRHGGSTLSLANIEIHQILKCDPISSRIREDNFYITPYYLYESSYRRATSKGAEVVTYDSLSDCFTKITQIVRVGDQKKFLNVYWPEFDSICHSFGTESPEALAHFRELEQNIDNLIRALKCSKTTLLITSDHGLTDTNPEHFINLNEHPDLRDTLSLPLCGEPRVAYCYVRPSRVNSFRHYVNTKLSRYCTVCSSHELIKKHLFGLFRPSTELSDRVGDYILIMKDKYIIKDFVLGENEHFLKANHGGVSKEEMYVPLITVSC